MNTTVGHTSLKRFQFFVVRDASSPFLLFMPDSHGCMIALDVPVIS